MGFSPFLEKNMAFRFWTKNLKNGKQKIQVCYQLSIEILKIDVPIAFGFCNFWVRS